MSSAAELYPTPRTLEDAETERLYEAYADRIHAYCVRRLRSRSDAEDAVQTTFLYAMRALRRGVEPECESAWLYTIAKNVCSWQQRTAARRGPIADDFELESLACAETDEDVERLAGLRDALQSLPARQREALVLREWHGVPAREIAVELGLTGPQTHALLTRARHALAQALSAPGKAALGLGALVVGVRAHFKAVLGGVAAKAAATVTIVVAGAGVTGAVAEESSAERAARDRAILAAATTSEGAHAGSVPAGTVRGPGGQPVVVSTPSGRPTDKTAQAESGPAAGAPPSADGSSPGDSSSTGTSSTAPASEPPSSSPAGEVPAKTSVQLPAVTVDLPGDVPPIVLPPVELPPVELPPVDVPLPVEVPPVQTPPVELPAVQVPSLGGSEPPLVDIPATQVIPPITLNP